MKNVLGFAALIALVLVSGTIVYRIVYTLRTGSDVDTDRVKSLPCGCGKKITEAITGKKTEDPATPAIAAAPAMEAIPANPFANL